jgi:hypothetical protein
VLKYQILVRKMHLSRELAAVLEQEVTDVDKVAPGQVRRRGDWYVLTYHRVVKIRNYDPVGDTLSEDEVTTLRATTFQPKQGRLLVHGTAGEVKEIAGFLEALALKTASNKAGADDPMVNLEALFRIEAPTVDLNLILQKYETRGMVTDVRKLRLKDVEVRLGTISRAVVNTRDFVGVKKILEQPQHNALGLELALSEPAKTFLYVDVDGQVRITCHSDADEAEIAKLALEAARMM